MNLNVYKIQYCTVQDLFQRTISIVFSFIKVLIYMNTTLRAYESLQTKEKFSWVIPKVAVIAYWSGCLRKLFITKFKSRVKRGLTKVVVTRAGRLREWS